VGRVKRGRGKVPFQIYFKMQNFNYKFTDSTDLSMMDYIRVASANDLLIIIISLQLRGMQQFHLSINHFASKVNENCFVKKVTYIKFIERE